MCFFPLFLIIIIYIYLGVGLETARVFALRGAQVFVIGRDVKKCNEEVRKLKALTGSERIL